MQNSFWAFVALVAALLLGIAIIETFSAKKVSAAFTGAFNALTSAVTRLSDKVADLQEKVENLREKAAFNEFPEVTAKTDYKTVCQIVDGTNGAQEILHRFLETVIWPADAIEYLDYAAVDLGIVTDAASDDEAAVSAFIAEYINVRKEHDTDADAFDDNCRLSQNECLRLACEQCEALAPYRTGEE